MTEDVGLVLSPEEREHGLRFDVGDGCPARRIQTLAHLQREQTRSIGVKIGAHVRVRRALRRAEEALMRLQSTQCLREALKPLLQGP